MLGSGRVDLLRLRGGLSGGRLLGLGILCGCEIRLRLGLVARELDGEHAGVFGCCGGLCFGCGVCLCFGLEAWKLDGEHAGVFGRRSWLSGCGLLGLGLRLGLEAWELDGEHAGVFGRRSWLSGCGLCLCFGLEAWELDGDQAWVLWRGRSGLRRRRRNGGCGYCPMGRCDRLRLGCLDRLSSGSRGSCALVVVGAE